MALGAPISTNLKSTSTGNYTSALAVLTSLFFIWAFITNLNDILIPHLKKALVLTDFESALVQTSFFMAYFVFSIPAGKIIQRIGYKPGIIFGLVLMFIGALIFVPAATTRVYGIFLTGLFVLASGITVLQVAANPYVAILGPPETSAMRLNLTQAFNSLGATLGPLLFGSIIFTANQPSEALLSTYSEQQIEQYRISIANSVIIPYIVLAGIIAVIAAIIYFSKLPRIDAELEQEPEITTSSHSPSINHLYFGVMAIFFYVGAEVSIGSFLIKFAKQPEIANMVERDAKNFVGAYMFLAMIGRFAGAAILSKFKANRLLSYLSIGAILLLTTGMLLTGLPAIYAIVAVGLCNSIMFPNIFTLAIKDLGKFTKQGSSYLIMAIVGGAIIPLLMGLFSDSFGIHNAFVVPLLCYLPILYFAVFGYKVKA